MSHCSTVRPQVVTDVMFSEKLLYSFGQSHKHGWVLLVEWCSKRWSSSVCCLIQCRANHLISIITDINSFSYCLHAEWYPYHFCFPFPISSLVQQHATFCCIRSTLLIHLSYRILCSHLVLKKVIQTSQLQLVFKNTSRIRLLWTFKWLYDTSRTTNLWYLLKVISHKYEEQGKPYEWRIQFCFSVQHITWCSLIGNNSH
jgi:hypothetical protein